MIFGGKLLDIEFFINVEKYAKFLYGEEAEGLVEDSLTFDFLKDHGFRVSGDCVEAAAETALEEYWNEYFDTLEEEEKDLYNLTQFLIDYGHADDVVAAQELVADLDLIWFVLENDFDALIAGNEVYVEEAAVRALHGILEEEKIKVRVEYEDAMVEMFLEMIKEIDVDKDLIKSVLTKISNRIK